MKKLIFIPLLFVSLILSATNYYVKNGGSDAANGLTDGTAWETIAKVNASTFSAGDSILFNKGDTWQGNLRVPSSGSNGNPIVFGAYGSGADPVIDDSFVASGWTEGSGGAAPTLISNGTFASDVTWSKWATGVTISDGVCHATAIAPGNWIIAQSVDGANGFIVGTTYKITFTISNYVRGSIRIYLDADTESPEGDAAGTFSVYITPAAKSDGYLYLYSGWGSDNFTGDIDNVSISEVKTIAGVYSTSIDATITRSYYTIAWVVEEDGVPLTLATSDFCTDGNYYFIGILGTLYYKPTSGVAGDHVITYSPHQSCINVSNRVFITITDLHLKNSYVGILGVTGQSPTLNGTTSNITIRGCTFERMNQQGILFFLYNANLNSDGIIEDNYFYRCQSGLSLFLTDGEGDWYYDGWGITNNEFEECGTYDGTNPTGVYDFEAIGLQNVQHFTITDNYIHGGLVRGINLYGEADGLIANNIITRNIVRDNNAPGFIVNGDWGGGWGWKDNLVAYNQFINCGSSTDSTFDSYAIRFEQDVKGAGGINKFVNNTIVSTSRDAMYLYINATVASQYLEIKNNIITGYSRSAYYMDGLITDLVIDHNLYDVDGKFYYETDWRSLSYIRSNTTYGDNDIIGNPLFTSNFHLQAGSPAINAGADVGLTSDYYNHSIQGLPDIGAYEYGTRYLKIGNKLQSSNGKLITITE